MRKLVLASALALAAAGVPMNALAADPAPTSMSAPGAAAAFEKTLNKQTGDVTIPAANVVLHLGEKYYFIGGDEAKRVLVDLWRNPPEAASDTLGLVLPVGKTVLDDSWGAVITYKDSGYVTDDDAATADYTKLLTDMREGEADENKARREAGYPGMNLVGWAQPPSYDKAAHSLIWARDLKVDNQTTDTLNYDVRVLGRKGVLSMNMLWDMSHLGEVRSAAADFGRTATFAAGSTYADYNSGTDKAAGYGLAGLVAAGVGVAAAKKLGILAFALIFLKKGFIVIPIALAAGWKWIKRLFGRGSRDDDGAAGVS